MEHLEPFPSFLYCTILDLFAIFPVFFFFLPNYPTKGNLKLECVFFLALFHLLTFLAPDYRRKFILIIKTPGSY